MCDSGKDEKKLKCAQIFMDGMPGYVVPIDQIGSWIQSEMENVEDEGEGFEIKLVYLTQEQIDKAPEFAGW